MRYVSGTHAGFKPGSYAGTVLKYNAIASSTIIYVRNEQSTSAMHCIHRSIVRPCYALRTCNRGERVALHGSVVGCTDIVVGDRDARRVRYIDAVPSVFGRKLQCEPVRKWTPECHWPHACSLPTSSRGTNRIL
jgi:hypothetical protein